ncbi:hypothetical protein TBR22_A17760 [Luteitalea sp. TBR-22]|uniref:sensor histidine kinase n=1 Tax=Luteitalea sp. TBR-22 TaxID=2802971 RepID=UPI001AFA3C8B|nr:HAMP domain-containing sensor histidine kinase [Luteitalea sp. TBR-22]BCS32562.1 hypothetical protein TBR22_A17760 [Luteitalea sp. TBR-22]
MHTHTLATTASWRGAIEPRRRLQRKGIAAAMVAHELAQPLAALMANLDAAAHHLRCDPVSLDGVREVFADLAADVARADAIVRHVLALVRDERTERSDIGVAEWLVGCAERHARPAATSGIGIAVRCGRDLRVRGDLVQLERVVDNLVVNALHALSGARDRGQVVIEAREAAGELVITVADNGPGFPAAVLAYPAGLATTKRDGSGLGLAVAARVARAHGGRLELANGAPGAIVTVRLPTSTVVRRQ